MSSSRVAAVAFVVALVLAVATVSYFGGGCPRPLLQEQDPGGMAALVREGGEARDTDPPVREPVHGATPDDGKPQGQVGHREAPIVVVLLQDEEGEPVDGVPVEFLLNGTAIAEVDTEAGGIASTVIHRVPAKDVALCARVTSQAAWGALRPSEDLVLGADAWPSRIELDRITVRQLRGSLVGVLVDSEGGWPIANAQVLVKMGALKAQVTGPNGEFEVPLDTTSQCHGFEVAAPDHESRRWRGLPPGKWSGGRYEAETIRLCKGVATAGRVIDHLGLPVSGVPCNMDVLSLWTGTSLEDGSIVFPGMKESRKFKAVAFGRGYGPAVVAGEAKQGGEVLIFRLGATEEWVVSIDSASNEKVSGRLEVRGIAGRRVYAADSRQMRCLRLGGDSVVAVKVEGYGEEVLEVAGATSSELRFALRAPARYVGVVTKGGAPIAGVGVRCGYGEGGVLPGLVRVQTDAVGAFVLEGVGVDADGLVFELGGGQLARRFDPNGLYSLETK